MQQEPSANPTEILNAIQHVRPGNNFQPEFTLFARADVNGQNRLSVYSWALVTTFLFLKPNRNIFKIRADVTARCLT